MRYTGECRINFIGPQEKCAPYISEARLFLGETLNQLEDLGTPGDFWLKKLLPDGVVIRVFVSRTAPVIEIGLIEYVSGQYVTDLLMSLVWRPEGLILTPVSANYPDGLGLPMRDPGPTGAKLEITEETPFGYTPGGVYPQVLLNKYVNNKYLDDVRYIEGLPDYIANLRPSKNPRLADANITIEPPLGSDPIPVDDTSRQQVRWEYGVLFEGLASYTNNDGTDLGDILEQYYERDDFDDRLLGGVYELTGTNTPDDQLRVFPEIRTVRIKDQTSIFEPEGTEWQTHRPEELLFELALQEGIFQSTNFWRQQAGRDPFLRPLRGCASAGYWGSREIGTSTANYFGHSHYDYRPGFRTAGGRNMACTGQEFGANWANNTCENALIVDTAVGENALEWGTDLVQYWVNSPGHYAAMITPVWDKEQRVFFAKCDGTLAYLDGTTLDVGAYGVTVNMETQFDVNDAEAEDYPFWNEVSWNGGETVGYKIFTQIFQQRESWLPTPEYTQKSPLGSIGKYSNPCVWGGQPNWWIRRFSVGPRVFELPPGTAPAFFDASEDPSYPISDVETDTYLGILNAWTYDNNGKAYVRVVVAESDARPLTATSNLTSSAAQNNTGTYLEIIVYNLPLALVDTGRISWRVPRYMKYYEERRQVFKIGENNIAPIAPTHAEFSPDGSEFALQMYEYGGEQTTQTSINNATPGNREAGFYESCPTTRKALRPRTVVYTASSRGFSFKPSQSPIFREVIVAKSVTRGPEYYHGFVIHLDFEENLGDLNGSLVQLGIDQPHTYGEFIWQVKGSYDVFPHYNPQTGQLQHVKLEIDNFNYSKDLLQRWRLYTPVYSNDDFSHYGWDIGKLKFPNGNEYVFKQKFWGGSTYYQQNQADFYTQITEKTVQNGTDENFNPIINTIYVLPYTFSKLDTLEFSPIFQKKPDVVTPQGDGTNDSFECVIQYMDVQNGVVLATKEVIQENFWMPDTYPADSNVGVRVVQSDLYIELLNEDGSKETVWSYIPQKPAPGGVPSPWDFGDYVGELYPSITKPIEDLLTPFDFFDLPFSNRFADNVQYKNFQIPLVRSNQDQDAFRGETVSTMAAGPYNNTLNTNYHTIEENTEIDFNNVELAWPDRVGGILNYVTRGSWDTYEVSCCPNAIQYFVSSMTNLGPVQLESFAAQPHNIAPTMNSDPTRQKGNVHSYKERLVARYEARHFPTQFGPIPPNNVVATQPLASAWTTYRPGDAAEDPKFVHVHANFNLDSATGIQGVTDIYPFAVIE